MEVVNLIHFKLIIDCDLNSLLMDDIDISLIDCDLRNEMDNIYVIWDAWFKYDNV